MEKKRASVQSPTGKLQQPPDNFRQKNVFPLLHDIFEKNEFLRRNIVRGKYKSVDEYLDIQFRLLREDFLVPLRQGIKSFIQQQNFSTGKTTKWGTGNETIENLKVYEKVKFQNAREINGKVGIDVHFDPDAQMKAIDWENSKRLMYESSVCFTCNNFQTAMFAIVAERNTQQLKKGIVTVTLTEKCHMKEVSFTKFYTMIESEVYFEPCSLVLNGLQSIHDSNMPMSKYIVYTQKVCDVPPYLVSSPTCSCIIGGLEFNVLPLEAWPSAEQLQLDEAQCSALQAALTQELTLIQGPPGTGKTFLGLKIARAIIDTAEIRQWRPLLVVCYTNHALDQFLEDIVKHTDRVVRVDGQSNSEILAKYNIKDLYKAKRLILNIIKWKNGDQDITLDLISQVRSEILNKIRNTENWWCRDDILDELGISHARWLINVHIYVTPRLSEKAVHFRQKITKVEQFLKCLEDRNGIISIKTLQVAGSISQKIMDSFEHKDTIFIKWLLGENCASKNSNGSFPVHQQTHLKLSDLEFVIHLNRLAEKIESLRSQMQESQMMVVGTQKDPRALSVELAEKKMNIFFGNLFWKLR